MSLHMDDLFGTHTGQAVQGPRRPQPALDRLRPQHRLAVAGRPGHLTDRVAAPPRWTASWPKPPRKPCGFGSCPPQRGWSPTPDDEYSRSYPAGNGPPTWPPPGTTCKTCTPCDPSPTRPNYLAVPGRPWNRRPPEHPRALHHATHAFHHETIHNPDDQTVVDQHE